MRLAGARGIWLFGVGGPLRKRTLSIAFHGSFTVQGGFGWVGH